MAVRNSDLIDAEKGVFSVLGLVALRLGGPYWWNGEDIDEEIFKGAVFRAYEPEDAEKGCLDVASITVVDATNDPTEPDISTLEEGGVPSLDSFLHESIKTQLMADGMELIKWMSSNLNHSGNLKVLVTAYIANDQGKQRQFIALRTKAKDRKIVAIGVFDVEKKEVLAVPIFNIMQNMVVLG